MFHCKYCGKDKEDIEVGIYYRCSVKCERCVKQGIQLKDIPRTYCPCGGSYLHNATKAQGAHLKSARHKQYLKSLVK